MYRRVVIVPLSSHAPSGRSFIGVRAAQTHAPDFRSLFQVIPGELAAQLGLELVKERLRVVVIDQDEALTWSQRLKALKDERMSLHGW